MRVAVSCGGTGGHMFPGLAVARVLCDRGHRVAVVLSGRDAENGRAANDLPPGVEVLEIPAKPFSLGRPGTLAGALRAVIRARRAFLTFRPDAVLAMGAYTSFAPVVAARLHWRRAGRVPVVLHEANAIPGSAVAHLARYATTVCSAFPGLERFFAEGTRVVETGMPLRSGFAPGMASGAADPSAFSLLVMGGSQGAQSLNAKVVALAAELGKLAGTPLPEADGRRVPRFRIVHLAGVRNEEEVRQAYAQANLDPARVIAEVVGFEHDMPRRYAEANLCISRAGASSCFELALAGLPAFFVPLEGLARDHQVRNAEAFATRGAGVLWREDTPASVAGKIAALAADPGRLAVQRRAFLALSRPDAAERVADEIEACFSKNNAITRPEMLFWGGRGQGR